MTDDLPQAFHKLAVAAIPQAARGFALSDAQLVEIADEGCKTIAALAAKVARLTGELAGLTALHEGQKVTIRQQREALADARADGVAEGLRMGLEHACSVIDAHSEYDQNMCCSGHECGCQGISVHQDMKHWISSYADDALIPAPAKPNLLDDCLGPREISTYLLRKKQMDLNNAGDLDAAAALLAEAVRHTEQAIAWWQALQAQERATREGGEG